MRLEDAPDALTVEQTASVLSISRGSAYLAVRSGEIPSVRLGRSIRVPRHALERLLDGGDRRENGGGEHPPAA